MFQNELIPGALASNLDVLDPDLFQELPELHYEALSESARKSISSISIDSAYESDLNSADSSQGNMPISELLHRQLSLDEQDEGMEDVFED